MADIKVEVIGLKEGTRKLTNISENTANEVIRTVFKSSQNIERRAKNLAPVDTGVLRARIETEIMNKGFTADIMSNADYSAFLEFGTKAHFPPVGALVGWARRNGMSGKEYLIARTIARRGTKAQPFMGPAYEDEKDNFINDIKSIFKSIE